MSEKPQPPLYQEVFGVGAQRVFGTLNLESASVEYEDEEANEEAVELAGAGDSHPKTLPLGEASPRRGF